MKETKTMQVAPSQEEMIIHDYQSFGWELLSSQEVKTKDSHLENRSGTIYNVTESEHYVKLVFTRDTNMPHYDELRRYQNQYESAIDSMEREPSIIPFLAFILLLMYIVPGVLYIVFTNKKIKRIRQSNSQKASAAEAAINAARQLL